MRQRLTSHLPQSPSRRRSLKIETLESRALLAGDLPPVLDINTILNNTNPDPNYWGTAPHNIVGVGGSVFYAAMSVTAGIELWKSDGTVAGTKIVKDIRAGTDGSSPKYLTNVNGTLFFNAIDNSGTQRLWKSDGTEVGTVQVTDSLDIQFVTPSNLINFNGLLFFGAGGKLWKSNGTAEATTQVEPLPGADSFVYLNRLTKVDNTLFFTAQDNYGAPIDVWKSDGSAAGTTKVKSNVRQGGSADLTNVNGTLYFLAYDPTSGVELWKSDGTTAGTMRVKVVDTSGGFSPRYLTAVNDILFFAIGNPNHSYTLWKSDGTDSGTVQVKSGFAHTVTPIPHSSAADMGLLTNVNGTLFFVASYGAYGNELWKSDGSTSGTVLVKDIAPNNVSSSPSGLTNFDGTLFFSANTGGQLWKSDGTEEGTVRIELPGGSHSPGNLTNANGTLFFSSRTEATGWQLWKSDGTTAGTVLLNDVGNKNSSPRDVTSVNGMVFFNTGDRTYGYDLWRSDGTAAGTVHVRELGRTPATYLTNVNGTLYFRESSGVWKSDGTVAGTVKVDLGFPISYFAMVDGKLYFYGAGIWASDGTRAGTRQITSIQAQSLTNVNGTLYFRGYDSTRGWELWKTNGTEDSTLLVKDIYLYGSGSVPAYLTNVNGTLFFRCSDETGTALWKSDGTAAGTVRLKGGLRQYVFYDNLRSLTVVGDTLYFVASDSMQVYDDFELWKSDGTTAGTMRVKDIFVGNTGSNPTNLTNVNGTLYFSATNSLGERELWKSDGTEAGTVQFKDIFPGNVGSNPTDLTNVNGILYFSANDGVHGVELWKSDGTAAGTVQVLDIAGPGSSTPRYLALAGNKLFFAATTDKYGRELYAIDTPYVSLSNLSISENSVSGSPIGTLASTITGMGPVAFQLVASAEDNASFELIGNQLRTRSSFDYEAKSSYTVRLRASTGSGQSVEQTFVINVLDLPEVQSVLIGDGTGQRSVVRSVQVTFDGLVDFTDLNSGDPAWRVFQVRLRGSNGARSLIDTTASAVFTNGRTVVTLTFSGIYADASHSLIDGTYDLVVNANKIRRGGNLLDGDRNGVAGGNYYFGRNASDGAVATDKFFRLFGDSNGDGVVGNDDLAAFNKSYRSRSTDLLFSAAFDYDGNGIIDNGDLRTFTSQYRKRITFL